MVSESFQFKTMKEKCMSWRQNVFKCCQSINKKPLKSKVNCFTDEIGRAEVHAMFRNPIVS